MDIDPDTERAILEDLSANYPGWVGKTAATAGRTQAIVALEKRGLCEVTLFKPVSGPAQWIAARLTRQGSRYLDELG